MKTFMTAYSDRETSCVMARGLRALAGGGTWQWLRGAALGMAFIGSPWTLWAAGPAPVDLGTTAHFIILSGAAITSTGGGIIKGDVGASPITGAAIGVTCAQVNGIIYAVDPAGPAPCAVQNSVLLGTAKGDLTTAYIDARDRTPVPTGPNLNPGVIPGNIGGLNLAPGLYKFTVTAQITGGDVTLTGGPNDVWIFQCAQDLLTGSSTKVILAGGAQAKNVFWQVGTSAVLGTFSSFQGTILADQSITMNTSSTLVGRLLAFSGGVTFNGTAGSLPPSAPEIGVQQPAGTNLVNGVGTNDFGFVAVGTNTSHTFIITNSGSADLTGLGIIIDGADADSFTVTTNPVAPVGPGSNTTFTVRFTPLTPGLKIAALHIASNDTNANPFDINLAGNGALSTAPEIGVQQPAGTNLVDGVGTNSFGSVNVGTNTSHTFIITNSGTADLTGLGIIIDGADAASFTITTNPVAPVGPGSNTTFTVRFTPLTPGLKIAALHIANNDTNENPFDINLAGNGALSTAPEIGVQQPAGTDLVDGVGTNNFGSVGVGTNTSHTFIITNSGSADLTGLGIIIDGADAASFTVTTNPVAPVGPGSNTTFTVRFTPLTPGLKIAALHIANNDTNENPFDINLAGNGALSTAPEIGVQQPAGTDLVDGVGTNSFGSVSVGTNTSHTFIITNSGTADLTGLSIIIDGADAASFTVTTNPVAPVGPGSNTTFTVRFTPLTPGLKIAALHIANNDTNENPFDINLAGNGALSTAPEIGVQQPAGTDLVDGVGTNSFGSVSVGTNTSHTFIITNSGSADLTGLSLIIDGADAASFTIITNPFTPVGPGSNTTFTVSFTPLTTGLKIAALHIANNDANENPFDIHLTGTGVPAGFVVTTNVSVFTASPIKLNPQTGLFEQTVRLTNSGSATITGLRLLILNLPVDVQVYNASGSTNGTPFVQYGVAFAPGTTVDLLIEYYRASRKAISQPTFVVQIIPPVSPIVTGKIMAIDRSVQLPDGRFLIEFTTVPGQRYAVQYSSDMQNWKTAYPVITAPANRVQWYDDGPPKTESKPVGAGSRFYQVLSLP